MTWRKVKEITPEEVEMMQAMWAIGIAPTEIAKRLGLSYATVRYRVDKVWAHHTRAVNAAWRARSGWSRRKIRAARDAGMQKAPELSWASFTAFVFGDPAIGRSALDRRLCDGPHEEGSLPKPIRAIDTEVPSPDAYEYDNFPLIEQGAPSDGPQRE